MTTRQSTWHDDIARILSIADGHVWAYALHIIPTPFRAPRGTRLRGRCHGIPPVLLVIPAAAPEQGRRSCGGSCWHPRVPDRHHRARVPALACTRSCRTGMSPVAERNCWVGFQGWGCVPPWKAETSSGNAGASPMMGARGTTSSARLPASLGMTAKGRRTEPGTAPRFFTYHSYGLRAKRGRISASGRCISSRRAATVRSCAM